MLNSAQLARALNVTPATICRKLACDVISPDAVTVDGGALFLESNLPVLRQQAFAVNAPARNPKNQNSEESQMTAPKISTGGFEKLTVSLMGELYSKVPSFRLLSISDNPDGSREMGIQNPAGKKFLVTISKQASGSVETSSTPISHNVARYDWTAFMQERGASWGQPVEIIRGQESGNGDVLLLVKTKSGRKCNVRTRLASPGELEHAPQIAAAPATPANNSGVDLATICLAAVNINRLHAHSARSSNAAWYDALWTSGKTECLRKINPIFGTASFSGISQGFGRPGVSHP